MKASELSLCTVCVSPASSELVGKYWLQVAGGKQTPTSFCLSDISKGSTQAL